MSDSQIEAHLGEPKDISINIAPHEHLLRISLYKTLLKAVSSIAEKTVLRILDIGSGRGELLHLLVEKGHQVVGIDPEKECVRLGSQYGTCFEGTFDDVSRLFKPGQFDVIVSSHVLEHVVRPIDALIAVNKLKAKGYVFAVPNVHRNARLIRLLLGSARADHPTHIYGWGKPEFEAALRTAGFKALRWYTDRVTINPFGGKLGALLTRILTPLEVKLLPRLFPLLSSSLIVYCEPIENFD
jgi:SAM-dependent methyltransferase